MAYAAAVHGRHAEAAAVERAGSRRLGRVANAHAAYAQPVSRTHATHRGSTAAAVERSTNGQVAQQDEAPETAADRRISARIHAWYDRQASAPAAEKPRTVARAAAASPDLSTTARKATVSDFDRAAAAQRDTIQAAAEQYQRQTTAADDNADAESHIPSTAPTERVPAPFVHGDTPEPLPANHSRGNSAPVVRQQQSSPSISFATQPGTAPAVRGSVPQAIGIAPVEARGKAPAVRAGSDASVLARTPIAIAAADDSSPRAARAIAAEVANSPTPHIKLPSPPSSALTKAAPAVSTVQSSARKPQLDPAVAEGMADENFDDDGAPATARTAIALANAGPAAAGRKVPAALQDDSGPLASLAAVNVNVYDGSGHLLVMAPMKGSHDILVHQNQMALADGLERIRNDYELAEMRRTKLLVSLPDDDSIYPNDVLPVNRRYARPWTVRFLRDLARAHYARFGTPLIITSAARTVEFQRRLVRVNGNAAPPTGDIASPHLYGQAVDLGKRGMTLTELTWMRAYLTPVEADGKIDVEEEFQQACFHISVYRKYLGGAGKTPVQPKPEVPKLLDAKVTPAPAPAPARKRRLPTALLATGLR